MLESSYILTQLTSDRAKWQRRCSQMFSVTRIPSQTLDLDMRNELCKPRMAWQDGRSAICEISLVLPHWNQTEILDHWSRYAESSASPLEWLKCETRASRAGKHAWFDAHKERVSTFTCQKNRFGTQEVSLKDSSTEFTTGHSNNGNAMPLCHRRLLGPKDRVTWRTYRERLFQTLSGVLSDFCAWPLGKENLHSLEIWFSYQKSPW